MLDLKQSSGSVSLPSPKVSRKGTNRFNRNEDYDVTLDRQCQALTALFEKNEPSPHTGLVGYKEISVLGAGSFGNVKLVKCEKNKYYACKILMKDHVVKTKQVLHVLYEKKVLKSVKFPFLVNLEWSTKDNNCLYLGLPFINGGELFSYHRKVHRFNEQQARFYITQVVLGLEYLHFCQLLYRDLKPENIMMCSTGYIKITDFGFTKKVENRTQTLCGTPEYLAPEIIQSKPYGTSVDWWALGVLVYELVTGRSPFSQFRKDVMLMYKKICEGEYKMPGTFSKPLRSLVKGLLEVDMTKRLGCLGYASKDIKTHEWFKMIDWYAVLNQELVPPYVPLIANSEDTSNFDTWPDKKIPQSDFNKYEELFQDF